MTEKLSEALSAVVAGVALGDALGNRLEFLRGPSDDDFRKQLGLPLIVSDDTQMMLFSLEGMRQGRSFADAYLRWFSTKAQSRQVRVYLAFPRCTTYRPPA